VRLIYLAAPLSPIRTETRDSNIHRAKVIYEALSLKHHDLAFLALWILNAEIFDETEVNRELGMKRNFTIINRCDELWLVGPRVSPGMAAEEAHAARCGIPVITKVKE
jgi:hypothetical protein